MKTLHQFTTPALACLAALCGPLASHAADPSTPIEEIVIYGIDGDTNELMRYTFETNTFHIIGVVQTADGSSVENTEALTWIPSGPAKGMYCVPRDGDLSGKLLRVNPLDASAEVVANCPYDDLTAMVSARNPFTGDWRILAWDFNDERLVAINPENGTAISVFTLGGYEFEGFALGPDGTFYANTDTELFTLDILAGSATSVGPTSTDKMESLEFAFGDYDPQVDVPGVPPAWTANGALLGFDDDTDAVMIIDPAYGSTAAFPCSFATVDCEGLVVMTKAQDPFGVVVVDACD
ncbi:MAG: hypothetical protein ACYS0G_06420 [Planctomycetota bacterium]|jgi:hypothetical protein